MTTATPATQSRVSLSERNVYTHGEPGIAAIQDTPTVRLDYPPHVRPLRFGLAGPAPEWLPETIQRLNHLLALPGNWDSEGAQRIGQAAAVMTLQLLVQAASIGAPRPTVGPTVEGGLQVEWHTCAIDLEIETLSSGRFDVLFEDQHTGADWEAEAGLSSPAIIMPLTELARRS